MFNKFFKSGSLSEQLERERQDAETARLAAEQAEQTRLETERQLTQQQAEAAQRESLDVDVAHAQQLFDAFSQAVEEATRLEAELYRALNSKQCLSKKRPTPFDRAQNQARLSLTKRITQLCARLGYEGRYAFDSAPSVPVFKTNLNTAPAAPPSPALTFSGRSWSTGEPIPSRE